jgi:hypothetical protein
MLVHCDNLLGRIERLWKMALAILITAGGGVLWGARLEWRVTETAANVVELKAQAQSTAIDVSRIKGHMNISKTPPPTSTLQTASIPPCTEPEQQTH